MDVVADAIYHHRLSVYNIRIAAINQKVKAIFLNKSISKMLPRKLYSENSMEARTSYKRGFFLLLLIVFGTTVLLTQVEL